jgi:hypothetical protein
MLIAEDMSEGAILQNPDLRHEPWQSQLKDQRPSELLLLLNNVGQGSEDR